MTREEAIRELMFAKREVIADSFIDKAYDMAISALKAQIDKDANVPNNDDIISRQAAIDALDVLCQEHRYKIPGKVETYSQYNEAWQDALDRAEGAVGNLPSAQPEKVKCKKCRYVYYDKEFGNYWCNRKPDSFMVEEDGYCKWGK